VRAFFAARGVLEVDTPVLGRSTVTDVAIDSLALDVGGTRYFLQTSPEYHMKRLLAAGAPSIVRIGPVFRADETGRLHNPEFTMVEWYRLGFDLAAQMAETRALVEHVMGPAPCRSIAYSALLTSVGAAADMDVEDLARVATVAGLTGDFSRWTRRDVEDLLITEAIARQPRGRFFVTDYPADRAALARLVTDAEGRSVAARFELIVDGVEIANGYDELADADALQVRMDIDRSERRAQGRFAPARDERLLEAMRAGLPSCTGVALGFDRLLMLAEGATRLEDVMPFPFDRA